MKQYRFIYLIGIFLFIHNGLFSQNVIQKKLDIKNIFAPGADLNGGIIGKASLSDPIIVTVCDDKFNTIIYQVTLTHNTTQFAGEASTFSKKDLGPGAIYYPDIWISMDIKDAIFAVDKKYADVSNEKPYQFLQKVIDVKIIIQQTGNSHFEAFKIPGIGEYGANPLFDVGHYCHDASKIDDCPCSAWMKIKSPDRNKNIDIMVAGHRGVWGSDLGQTAPENSQGAIEAAKGITPVIEFDITIMKDDVLIGSHDYNLKRLSDFTGSNDIFLFDIDYPVIKDLKLRRRDFTISDYHYIKFEDVVDLLVQNELVVLMDIKELKAHKKGGKCIANCDYDPETNPNAVKLIKESWLKIFRISYNIAKQKNALAYITYKVALEYDELKDVLTEEELSKVLFMPVIQPSNKADALDKALKFSDDWLIKADKRIVAFETNFKTLDAPILTPFSYNGKKYDNIMHYVYNRAGLRGGLFAEEPCGSRGVVNRWADWMILNMKTDIRGNHLDLINIPYGNIMLMTSDRIDIWKQIVGF